MSYITGPVVQLDDPLVAAEVVRALDMLAELRTKQGALNGASALPLSPATRAHRDACERLAVAASGNHIGRGAAGTPTMSVQQVAKFLGLQPRTVRYRCGAWAREGKARKVGRDWRIDIDVS